MIIKCKICEQLFEHKSPKQRICSVACRKIADQRKYKKWKANNPKRYKEFQSAQYRKRARDGRVKIKYAYRGTPQPPLHKCQKCGRLSINYFNCPVCLKNLSEGVSGEYPNFIYETSEIDIVLRKYLKY